MSSAIAKKQHTHESVRAIRAAMVKHNTAVKEARELDAQQAQLEKEFDVLATKREGELCFALFDTLLSYDAIDVYFQKLFRKEAKSCTLFSFVMPTSTVVFNVELLGREFRPDNLRGAMLQCLFKYAMVSEAMRERIEALVHERITGGVKVSFEFNRRTEQKFVCSIELPID